MEAWELGVEKERSVKIRDMCIWEVELTALTDGLDKETEQKGGTRDDALVSVLG